MLYLHKLKTTLLEITSYLVQNGDLGAVLTKQCFKNDLFFLFLITNIILFKGNLEGARSLDRFIAFACLVNFRTVDLQLHAL
jgi:hypothetical protein